VLAALGEFGVQLSTDAVMHMPVEVTERVMERLVGCNADCIVTLDGGSTIGLAKALALSKRKSRNFVVNVDSFGQSITRQPMAQS
jgi:maleylacetate reductase